MVFKVADEKEESKFVESMHAQNISEETLKVLKKTKQPLLPILYDKAFYEVLSKMPEEIKKQVKDLSDSYAKTTKEATPEDIKVNFDNIIKLLQHVATLYKRIKRFQSDVKNIGQYIKASIDQKGLIKVTEHLENTMSKSDALILASVTQLKKEYLSVKMYVQSIHDETIYDKNYKVCFTEDFFFQKLENDMSLVKADLNIYHGVFFVKLSKKFIASLKQNAANNSFDVELSLINQSLSISILQHLRRIDYMGILGSHVFLVAFSFATKNAFENFVSSIVDSIASVATFTSSDFLDLDIAGIYLDIPSVGSSDIKKGLVGLIKQLEEAKSKGKKYIVKPISTYHD